MSSSLAGRAISPGHLPPALAARLDESVPVWRPLVAAIGAAELVPAWATVELDRAERELAAAVTSARRGTVAALVEDAPPDALLGARSRRVAWASGAHVVILEPSTEGRLAGALARHGEGWVAVYAIAAAGVGAEAATGVSADELRRLGVALGAVGNGPLGAGRLLLGGPRDGPYLVVVSPEPRSDGPAAEVPAPAGW